MLKIAFCLGLVPALLVTGVTAQVLPEFDSSDFQVVSLEPSSKALAVSNGRAFYCSVQLNSDSGYVLVSKCLPFVGYGEAAEQEAALEPGRVAAEKAVADALQAEADAKAAVWRAITLGAVIVELTKKQVTEFLLILARRDDCSISVGNASFSTDQVVKDIASIAGINPPDLNYLQLEVLRELMQKASVDLYSADRIVFSDNGTKMTIKDCN